MNKLLLGQIGKKRLRATFQGGDAETTGVRVESVDQQAGLLRGVQICLEGEAKGHDVWLGADFIEAVAEQGNSYKKGVKVRFGHPNMCSDALGTFLGRAKNFHVQDVVRVDGQTVKGVFADVYLAQEAKNGAGGQDLYTWTLETAVNNPDTFGQSIVFTYADFYVLDADGNKHLWSDEPQIDGDVYGEARYKNWMAKSADQRMYAMLDKLHGTDFTDTPAATDGVFSGIDTLNPDTLAREATDLLDAHPRILEILAQRPAAVAEFIERYSQAHTALTGKAVTLTVGDGKQQSGAHQKRLTSLQSAKDREIAALNKKFLARIEQLQSDLTAAQTALSTTTAEHENLGAELATLRKQLTRERANLAKITGAALTHTEPGQGKEWEQLQKQYGYAEARKRYPDVFRQRFNLKGCKNA